MKKVMFAGLSLLSLVVLIACGEEETKKTKAPEQSPKQQQQTTVQQIAVGKEAPDFTLQSMDGKEVKLSDYKGKKVYLKFWASWCPICLAGLADINQLADMPPKDAVVLTVIAPGVNREKNLDDFKEWFSGLDYKTLPVLVDNNGQFLKKLGIVGYPSSAFIDANGKVVRVQPGHVTNEDIVKTLETL